MNMGKEDTRRLFAAPPDAACRARIETALERAYPSLVRGSIGHSMLGRPLTCFRIGHGPHAVLYVGAHHGMEWITSLLLYRLINDLCLSACRRGESTVFPGGTCLYVLPMLNPDGVEIELHGAAAGGPLAERLLRQNGGDPDFSRWQANARGVDLNHNYDAGFEEYRLRAQEAGISAGGPTRYGGEGPMSEPETAALCRFLSLVRPALILTLHTQGEEIFYHPTDPPVPHAAEWGALLARLTGYRLGQADGLAAYGGLSDYAAAVLRIPSFTLECGLGENPLPLSAAAPIYRRLRRALYLGTLFGVGQGEM